jgi:hypothetical protein
VSYKEWLDIDVLEDYLDGKLDGQSMHKVEKLSLEDPFVAQALAGLGQSRKRSQSLSLLQKQLKERIAQKPLEKKRWTITSQRLSIAAAAAVLFVTVSVLFWMRENNRQNQIASNKLKNVEVNIAPQIAITKSLNQPSTDEIAVLGYKTYKNTSSIPLAGWPSLTKYLITNNKLVKNATAKGKVVKLSFKIQKNGRPSRIQIIQGLGKGENAEAIRLIDEGPNWSTPLNSTSNVTLGIMF